MKPDKPAREDFFLHVLHASDAEKPAALPKVELQDVPSRIAAVKIALPERTTRIAFVTLDVPEGHIEIVAGGKKVVDEALAAEANFRRSPGRLAIPALRGN